MNLDYKKLIIFPVMIGMLAVGYSAYLIFTGSINMDIDLKGGTELAVLFSSQPDIGKIESSLKDFGASARIGSSIGSWVAYITMPLGSDSDKAVEKLRSDGFNLESYSVSTVGPSLGSSFLGQAMISLVAAFIFMSITVFIIFRLPLPSFYMVVVAFLDIAEAFAVSQILGIKLSLATFAALLLLIGYSVDTDVLLTTRVLKRKGEGTVDERIKGAMKTGLTMSGTTIAAVVVMFLLIQSPVIAQISAVLIIGLLFDVLNTWIINAGLVKWYAEKGG